MKTQAQALPITSQRQVVLFRYCLATLIVMALWQPGQASGDSGLPIGAEQARARGVELPLPFGIAWYHMDQEQPFDVKRLDVRAMGSQVPASVENLENRDVSDNLRLDAWIYPFLDLYFIVGHTDSESEGVASVPPGVLGPTSQRIAFEQDYNGETLGLGATLIYGIGNFFASLDFNYTQTDIDIAKDHAKAKVINPRFGWTSRDSFRGSLWLGAMYQDLEQTLEIETRFMGVPVTAVIEQEAEEPLNYVAGGRWEFDKHFHAQLECGFGKERDHWMASLGYRF